MVIFLIYIGAISRMKDIQRVFQYHGAEHKTIFAYEAGFLLEVANVRGFTTLHPRCGTNFSDDRHDYQYGFAFTF